MKAKSVKQLRNFADFAAFTAPAVLLIMISIGAPFLINFYYVFRQWNGISRTTKFIGLGNFVQLVSGASESLHALAFTFKLALFYVLLANFLALLLALALDKSIKTKNILRAFFYLPQILSLIVIGFIWKFMLTNAFSSFYDLTRIGFFNLSWLGDTKLVFISVVVISIWQSVGFFMVIFIAGLQSIPHDIIEASNLDGATGSRRLFSITLPLLMPAITANMFFSMLSAMKSFDIILTLTNGGPGKSTATIAFDIYIQAFQNNQYGYGIAESIVFFVIILVITTVQNRFFRSREVEV
jgi:raffinose/stachyose/melibiose transport system permease protein